MIGSSTLSPECITAVMVCAFAGATYNSVADRNIVSANTCNKIHPVLLFIDPNDLIGIIFLLFFLSMILDLIRINRE